MSPEEAQARFAAARVARLATADVDGVPHLVPVVFAVETGAGGDVVYSAVDAKPKRTTALRRLANVRANPHVTLLVDGYDDADWDALWWVRADGDGQVVEPGRPEARHAVGLLAARYRQYRDAPPSGPVLAVRVTRWSGWTAGPGA